MFNGKAWFRTKDVATNLEYKNTRQALLVKSDDDKKESGRLNGPYSQGSIG